MTAKQRNEIRKADSRYALHFLPWVLWIWSELPPIM